MREFTKDKNLYYGEDLSYTLFKNIQANVQDKPINFERSDFRGSKLINCLFENNKFDRADFIDCIIQDVTFHNVDWGMSLFKNVYCERVMFMQNSYNVVAVQECTFIDSTFDERNICWTLTDCTFKNCIFKNARFDHSSIDTNTFINCTFVKCNMAECHMENIKFQDCLLRHVELDPAYISSYMCKDTDLSGIILKYRGEVCQFANYFETELDYLKKHNRYFNFINLSILSRNTKTIVEDTRRVMQNALGSESNIRFFNIKNLLLLFEFYYNSDMIDFITYQKILMYLQELDFQDCPFEERLEYDSILYRIMRTNTVYNLSYDCLNTININEQCLCRLHIEAEDYDRVQAELMEIFQTVKNELIIDSYNPATLFEIQSIEPGSIILTIASSLLVVLLFSKIVKSVHHDIQEMRIERVFADKTIQNINSAKTTKQLQNVADQYNMISTNTERSYNKVINKFSNSILIGEIISVIITLIM